MAYIIGLTGGVASGKSTTAALFKSCGAGYIDADSVSHRLTGPNGRALPAISETFGASYLTDAGLDRKKMRELVFRNAEERRKLEAILHPLIHEELQKAISGFTNVPYVVLEAALLVEKEAWRRLTDRILLIDVSESTQLSRMMETRGLSEEIARGILASQSSREMRLRYADDVISNSGSLDDLRKKVFLLHEKYLTLTTKNS